MSTPRRRSSRRAAGACRESASSSASAEALPFEDDAFDYALAQLVVNFMTDAPAGVREMAASPASGGTVAAAVWDYAGEMTLLRRFWDAAVALDPSVADRDEGHSMPFCAPEPARGAAFDRRPRRRRGSAAVVGAGYEGFEDLWEPLERGVAPSGAYAASLSPPGRAALKEEFRRRLGVGDAPFRLTARAWLATGRVP